MSLRYRIFNYLKQKELLLVLLILLIGWFIAQTSGIWISFFLAYIITSALLPFVIYLQKRKLPKILAVLIPYVCALIVIVTLLSIVVNTFIPEIAKFFMSFPALLNKSVGSLHLPIDGKTLQTYFSTDFSSLGSHAFSVTSQLFGSFLSVITIIIVSFYLLLYHEKFHDWLSEIFGPKYKKDAMGILEQVDDKLGAWMRGQILLSLTIGLSIFFALTILNVPFALPLGIVAGLFEVLPTIGPTLAAIPSVIVGLTISPSLALIVVALYICIQFAESHLLVPNIMQKAVGLNPVLVILGIGIGANLLGIPGALLAVPFISFLTVIFTGIQQTVHRER
ncbi:MAG TPA: AI-2E family transporter [Patescibacteria group bacterium]|nr:AI-2E family transporter [Patescibacteria group bacterium]